MDPNEGIIDAEADVDQRLAAVHSARPAQGETHRAEHAALIAAGGAYDDQREDDEDTPLLNRQDYPVFEDISTSKLPSGPEDDGPAAAGDFDGLPWWKRPSIFWILGPFLLFTIAFGGTLVPKINLIQDLLCRDYYMDLASKNPDYSYTPIMFGQDDGRCTDAVIERRAASFLAGGSLIAGLLSAITTPKIGEMSDYYGRVKIMIATVSSSLVGEVMTVYAATHTQTFGVYWLYLGWVFEGLGGSFIAGMALTNSYASDVTPPSKRNVAFGYFHGCLFTGIALGPLIAARLMQLTGGIAVVFILALVCHCVFIICMILFIPESLSKRRQLAARENRRKKQAEDRILQQANDATRIAYGFAAIFRPLKTLYPKGPGASSALRRNLVLLAAIDFIVFSVAMGAMNVVTIYVRKQFAWDAVQQSQFISAVNISRVLMLVVIMPLIVKMFRTKIDASLDTHGKGCDTLDLNLIRAAIVFDLTGYLGYTLARKAELFTLSGIVASLGGMASPTLQSALTKHVPHDRTGQLLGATGLLHAMGRVVSPVIFNGIFAATNEKFRQTVFACLTGTFCVALVLTSVLRTGTYLDDEGAAEERSGEQSLFRDASVDDNEHERANGAPEISRDRND